MAIKGKKRSKQRSSPRPPRREPVAPPTPFLRRRWVQLTAGFLVGALAMVVLVWVTNTLRADEAEAASEGDAANRLAAATAYQQAVRGAFSQVGVVDPGVAPTIFAEMDAALDALAEGNPPANAEATFEQAIADAREASRDLRDFDVASTIADQGFDVVAATSFTNSAQTLAQALESYRRSAEIAAAAERIGGSEGRRLAALAVDLRDAARAELADGWTEYLQALRAGGIPEAPTTGGIVPELPGGGG
ncbi:MAG TPA: hypothetical protein VG993_09035 [Actinomycetota bacterium]|jgi:hypothetical protein|nr:hypothetical protein [Actinomycetota bacterium]